MALTNTACLNAKPKDKVYKLYDGNGLFLLVKPNNKKHWRLKYYHHKKERLLALGAYPLVSLADARKKTQEARVLLEQGIDPVIHKRKLVQNEISNAEDTFEFVANEWFENRKSRWTERYAQGVMNRLTNDIFPQIGRYPIDQIEPPMVLAAVRLIEKRNAKELARRQLQKCGEIFQYAIATGRIKYDPTYKLSKALEPVKKSHYKAISSDELPEFLEVLEKNHARLFPTTRNAMTLMMLTFVRTSELINAEWKEIDLDNGLWSIPAERMKMKRPHKVPLSNQAVEILKDQKNYTANWDHVFPSPVRPKQSMSNNTILGALKRMGYKGRMTGHGFRSLAMSTIKEKLHYRHEVIDRQLGHVQKNKIDRAYDRADYIDDRTVMMQDWADYIDSARNHG